MLVPNVVTVVAVAGLAADASTRTVCESLCGVPDVHCHQPYEGALNHHGALNHRVTHPVTHPVTHLLRLDFGSTAPVALAWECVLDYI